MDDPNAKTSEQISKEVAERIALASAGASAQVQEVAVGAAVTAGMSTAEIEELVKKMLADATARNQPIPRAEPDWTTLTESEALDLSSPIYIPVIEHDVPAYMDIRLEDAEYDVVWASQDQRRIGQLQAEGYEFLRREHISKSFKLPLKFDSEGLYKYQDTVAMRVHKRILYGKRRKVVETSYRQLKGAEQLAKSNLTTQVIHRDSVLEKAFEKGSMGFF